LTDTTRDDVREKINLGIWSKWKENRKGYVGKYMAGFYKVR